MTIRSLLINDIINDDTKIIIRNDDNFRVIAYGNWYEDNIVNYNHREIESFTWEKENIVYIDIAE